jgi:hypothetical protein
MAAPEPSFARFARSPRLRAEDGFVRGIVVFAVMLAVVAVVVLDSVSMFSAGQKVERDARSAAGAARFSYSQSSNIVVAEQKAKDWLRHAGDKVISVKSEATAGEPTFTVSASRKAHTYALKYGTHLPWIGQHIGRWLHPHSTQSSR